MRLKIFLIFLSKRFDGIIALPEISKISILSMIKNLTT
jgi:hypothetical protein